MAGAWKVIHIHVCCVLQTVSNIRCWQIGVENVDKRKEYGDIYYFLIIFVLKTQSKPRS